MISRCIKTFIPNDRERFIANYDMRDYMEIGNEYVVYRLEIAKEAIYYMIFKDHLLQVPSQLLKAVFFPFGQVIPTSQFPRAKYLWIC